MGGRRPSSTRVRKQRQEDQDWEHEEEEPEEEDVLELPSKKVTKTKKTKKKTKVRLPEVHALTQSSATTTDPKNDCYRCNCCAVIRRLRRPISSVV